MQAGKRILIVYYSLSGNTERVARDLADRLGADLEQVRERTNRRGFLGYLRATLDALHARPAQLIGPASDAGNYALTIVGTPIWAGKITPAARTYLRLIRDRATDIAFFTTSGGTPAAKVVPGIERMVGRKAVVSASFTQHDLADEALYQHKLDDFVTAVKLRPTAQENPRGVAHAHASVA